jgi:hypothetical protein
MSSNLTFWVSEITAALAELISAPLALPGGPGGGSGEFAGAITGRLSRESTLRFGSREVGRVATSEAGDLGIVQTVRQWFRGRAERAMLARELHDAEEVLRVAQMPSRGPAAQTWSRSRIVSDLVGGDAAVVRQSARMARATGFSYRPLQRGALAGIDDATLVGHGVVENPTGGATLARLGRTYGDLSASDLARVLVEDLDWRGGTLRLPLCNTALRDPHGRVFAEELASELARRHAPTVVIAPRGGVNTVGGLPAVRPLPGGELLPTAAFQRGGWEYFGP